MCARFSTGFVFAKTSACWQRPGNEFNKAPPNGYGGGLLLLFFRYQQRVHVFKHTSLISCLCICLLRSFCFVCVYICLLVCLFACSLFVPVSFCFVFGYRGRHNIRSPGSDAPFSNSEFQRQCSIVYIWIVRCSNAGGFELMV